MSASRYIYTDPRGLRTGPFTEEELRRLAEVGGLEFTGFVELEGAATRWRVAEVPWLSNELLRVARRGRRAAAPAADGVAQVERPGAGASPEARAPAQASQRAACPAPMPCGAATAGCAATARTSPQPSPQPIARSMFVLLGLLPALVGIFGIHNIVAGYIARGVVQLVLSLLTIGTLVGGAALPLCCCLGVPLWPVLFVWTLVEVIVVVRDARGVAFS